MSYSNITVVTAQGTYGYELGTSISYNTLDLIADIPHDAQLEIERIFSTDRNGLTATIPNFLNDVNVSVVDKQKVFLIPVSRCTFNTATKQITAINLPETGDQVYDFTYIPISGANVGIPQTIAVPQLRAGDNIIVRRKTVSNTPLVQWVPGSKLTTAQLNLNTLQMLYLVQEILNKVTIVSISTEQILDNAITSPKILNKAVTFSKLQDLSGPLKLLGSGSDPINFRDVREMSVGPGFDVVGNVIDVKPIPPGQRNDINVVSPNSDWQINPNAVTYAKMQAVATANRVLGSATAGGAVSEVQVSTNMLADNAVTFAKMQSVAENILVGRTTGAGNLEVIALSAAGRELINDASVPDMRQTLGLGSAALSASTDFATAVHTHGNLTSDGRLGSTSGLPVVTTTNGAITTGTFGTTGGTFAQGNDARFSDARTPLPHPHLIDEITDLQTNLNAKSNVGHGHIIGDVSGLQNALNDKANTSHTHIIANVTGLQEDLNNKSNIGHGHIIGDIEGLQTSLNNKASTTHSHVISDVDGLQAALNAKVDDSQISAFALTMLDDATAAGVRTTLELGTAATQNSTAFAAASHTHPLSQITDAGSAASKNAPSVGVNATSSQVVMGDDTRLTDARTPVAHTHGNISNTGAIGTTANLPIITGTSGALVAGSFGTTANTFCQGNDSRLSNSRTPLAHDHSTSDITSGTLDIARIPTGTTASTVCVGNDSRLSDARTPVSHPHVITDTTGLEDALNGKASTTHTHAVSDITSGTLGISRGGTGLSSTPTNGQILIGNNSGFSLATITAGTNIAISNSPGGITISQVGEPVAPSALLADDTYGDINISGNTWTVVGNAITTVKIANSQVTLAKLQNIATNKLLGRSTAGSGVVEEIDLTAAGRALLDDADAAAQRTTLGLGTSATLNVAVTGDAASGEVVRGNDSRLTNTRTPTAHVHAAGDITSGTLDIARIPTGTAVSTVCIGNDSRLSDARTPTAHVHGNITNAGAIGSTPNLPVITGTSGVLQSGSFGTTANTFCQGNDARLSDSRTPLAHPHVIEDTTGLLDALNNKLNSNLVSAFALTVLDDTDAASVRSTLGLGTAATSASSAFAAASHTHTIAEVDNLQATLDNKTDVGHAHIIDSVTGLQAALNNKTDVGHTHSIANVTNLQTELNDKLNSSSVSSFMLTVLDDATAAAAQATLGLGSAATQASTAFAAASHTHNTNDIVDDAITYAKMQNVVTANRVLGSTTAGGPVAEVEVQTAMIANGAVTEAKIGTNAVTTNKILNANVTEAKIANGAITSDKIASGAITYGKLPTMVTANRLLGGTSAGASISEVQVNTSMIQNNAVTTEKILDANITSGKLDAGVAAANLGTGGVTASLLGTDAVTTLKILDLNVTSSKIANNAITNGKLRTSAATSVIGRSANTVGEVADIIAGTDGHVLRRNAGVLEFGPVTSVDIAANSISYDKLANMVTTNRVLGSSAVDGAISATQVTSGMIADGAVTAVKLAGDLVIPVANLPAETKYTFDSNQVATGVSTVTFTGIPTNAKRITLVFWGLSFAPAVYGADALIRVGGSSIVTSGYVCTASRGTVTSSYTTSFGFNTYHTVTAANSWNWWGTATLQRLASTNNGWVFTGSLTNDNLTTPRNINTTGALGVGNSSLTQIQIFPDSGTFDNGSISLYYEV